MSGRLGAVCCAPVMCKKATERVEGPKKVVKKSWMNSHSVETCIVFSFLKRFFPIPFLLNLPSKTLWKNNFVVNFFGLASPHSLKNHHPLKRGVPGLSKFKTT